MTGSEGSQILRPGIFATYYGLLTRRSLLTCFCSSVFLVPLAELTLKELALDGCLLEALSEEVLRRVTSAVTSVANNWDHHLLVYSIIAENFFETIRQVEESFFVSDFRLKNLRFHL